MRIRYRRSDHGYGRSWTLEIRGKHRARLNSPGSLTPMRPHFYNGGDENCNRATSLHLWPLFGIDVWWEPNWRPDGSGICDKCRAEFEESDR